ncbi:MAG: hypothetical protein JJU29_23655 [Verrucomicrobia bacterium]|nr:hypothetical protein [Verrucomicrobiota bacterium]MCH8510360.1 hypothetical protein [Kiritimatiellia bacterium]
MQKFRFEAVNQKGQPCSGSLKAEDVSAATSFIRKKGLIPTHIVLVRSESPSTPAKVEPIEKPSLGKTVKTLIRKKGLSPANNVPVRSASSSSPAEVEPIKNPCLGKNVKKYQSEILESLHPEKEMKLKEFVVRLEDLFKEEIQNAAQATGKQSIASAVSLRLDENLRNLLNEKIIEYKGKKYMFEDFFKEHFGIDKSSYLEAKIRTLNERYGIKDLLQGSASDLSDIFHRIRAEMLVHALNLRNDDRTLEYVRKRKRSFDGATVFEADEEELSSFAYIYLVAQFWKYFRIKHDSL